MTPSPHTPHGGSDIRQRVLLLTRRWLPVLLSRIGVAKLEGEKLRALMDDEELELDLAGAREAVEVRAGARGERHEPVSDALETISKLALALAHADTDQHRAHTLVDEVDRQWLRLVLFGPRASRSEIFLELGRDEERGGGQSTSLAVH